MSLPQGTFSTPLLHEHGNVLLLPVVCLFRPAHSIMAVHTTRAERALRAHSGCASALCCTYRITHVHARLMPLMCASVHDTHTEPHVRSMDCWRSTKTMWSVQKTSTRKSAQSRCVSWTCTVCHATTSSCIPHAQKSNSHAFVALCFLALHQLQATR